MRSKVHQLDHLFLFLPCLCCCQILSCVRGTLRQEQGLIILSLREESSLVRSENAATMEAFLGC